MDSTSTLLVGERHLALKHLDKIYSQSGQILKAEIVDYYLKIAPLLLPHIINKPFSMIHFPEGVGGKTYYQKQCPLGAPEWINRVTLPSSAKGAIDWCLVNNAESVIYMANRSVMEMHTWFSRLPDLTKPDIAVIDLDPCGNASFKDVLLLAHAFGVLLKELKVFAVPKTSGSSGIHIYIPIIPVEFSVVQKFLNILCKIVMEEYPAISTIERSVADRGDKVYLDAVQNAYGKTIAAPYSLRAREGVNVSTPLLWEELTNLTIKPSDFNIKNIFARLEKTGDLFKDFYLKAQTLPDL